MIDIIYEDNHLLIVNKPVNIPVQADSSNDQDFLSLLKLHLKEKYNKPNNVYLGLIHRLDRMVSGIMVFCKTSKSASRLSEQIRNNTFKKTYLAIICGSINNQGRLHDYLLKDSKLNISKVVPKNTSNAKEAILDYELIESNHKYSLVKINLITGRSHQIRVQFSHNNNPLLGDIKYNKINTTKTNVKLLSYSISFYHPITKEYLTFTTNKTLKLPIN